MMIPSVVNKGFVRLIVFICLFHSITFTYGQQQVDSKRVIFFKETQVLLDLKNDATINRFTPSLADIDNADSLLNQYFKTNNATIFIDSIYRQYVGLRINYKKCIYINASCRQPDHFLQNTYYPKGGGRCYFRTIVDVDAKWVVEIGFNAPK